MKRYLLLGLLLSSLTTFSFSTELLTVAERSDFKSTATYSDVIQFIDALKKQSPHLKVETLAISEFGKEIPMMMLANPMPESPNDLKNDKRMLVYIQANIHAGEVEGKEASLMLARDLLKDMESRIFDNLIIIIVPILNTDGNDQISKQHRTNQNGPENGVGLRYNGQQLDINRDGLKVETLELKGLLKNIFNKWDPALTVDCHTTNGSYHEEAVTFTWMMNPNGDRNLINYMRDKMMPFVNNHLRDEYKVDNCFYGEFTDRSNPAESNWVSYASAPRYLTNYIGIRNRFSILNENYVYADYKSRVMGCYYLLHSILDYAAANAQEMKKAINKADKLSIERGLNPHVKDSFAIEYKGVATPNKVTIKAFEAEVYTDDNGRRRYRKTDRKRTVNVPYIADYIPTKQIKFPYAYLINISDKTILENLKNHGIKVERLSIDIKLKVEQFTFEEIKPETRINQGHYLNIVKGRFESIEMDFKAGTYLIRTSQKLGSLIAYLLEPQSDDNLLKWNFFDRYLRPQWGSRYFPYPVYKLMVKTDFESHE